MRVSSLLCWSCFFASFIAAHLLPRQTGIRNLYGTVNGAARGTARSLSRGSPRGTADSLSRGPIRGTNSSLSNDFPGGPFNASAIGPAGGPTGGIHTAPENATSKMYLNSTADVLTCLFVVQDVVSVRYWAHYESEIYSMKINVRSTITKVTKYIDTTITNVITTTVLTTTTGTRVYEEGKNLLTAYNEAPRPSSNIQSLNGSVITTLGFTITSPQPFFVYNTISLIQMPAILLENGNSACVAASTKLHFRFEEVCNRETISNINPYLIDYWSTTDMERSDPYATATEVVTSTALKVVLDPPFVYQPDWATTSDYHYARPTLSTIEGFVGTFSQWVDDEIDYVGLGRHGKGYSDYGYEDYGYIPQVLVDKLLDNSGLSSAYFQSVSLLPGGPMIDTGSCDRASPLRGAAVEDLTDSSEETVNIAGCFHPGACPGANEPAVAVTTPAAEFVPQSASVPARINHSMPAIKTQAASIKTSLVAPAGAARSSDTGVAMAPPQILPLQSSQTEQSNGGTPGQQLPPQPNHSPIATAQKFNGATPDQKSPSQPDANPASSAYHSIDGVSGKESSQSQSSLNLKTPTQNLNGDFDEQSQPQSGFNSVSPAQNANDGTQDQISSLLSNPNFITLAQNFKEATSDQDFSSQPNVIPVSPAEVPEAPKPAVALMITVGPLVLTANSRQNFIIGSQTLAPGSSPIVAFGNTLFLLPSASALVVNGITLPLTAAPALPTLGNNFGQELNKLSREQKQNQGATSISPVIGDNQSLAANSVLFVIDRDQTLAVDGASVIVAGASFTLASSKLAIVTNGATTAPYAPDAVPFPVPTLADNGRTIVTNAPGQPSFNVQALSPDSGLPSVAHIAGQGSTVIVNGAIIHSEPSSSGVTSAASLGHIIPELVIDSQTAFAGGTPITASGLPISLSPLGNEIIVGNSTERISSGSTLSLTIGSQTIIATLKNGYVIGNQTLTPGAAVTNVGTLTSLVPGGSGPAIQGSATNTVEAGQTAQSSSENFTGDAAKALPGLKTVAGISIVIFFTKVFFLNHVV